MPTPMATSSRPSLTAIMNRTGTDKMWVHRYDGEYIRHFEPLRDKPIRLLEIGIGGYSMADLGLSFNDKNELQLDTGTLSTVLTSNLSGVTTLLSAQTTTSSSQLSVVNTSTSAPSSTLTAICRAASTTRLRRGSRPNR